MSRLILPLLNPSSYNIDGDIWEIVLSKFKQTSKRKMETKEQKESVKALYSRWRKKNREAIEAMGKDEKIRVLAEWRRANPYPQ